MVMNRIQIGIAVLALPFMAGCSNFLDTTPTDRLSDKMVWTSEKYVDQYINNFYVHLSRYGQFGEDQFGGALTEGLTDTFKYGGTAAGARAGNAATYAFYPERITSSQNNLDIWSTAYQRIRRINEFLDSQKKNSTFSEEVNIRYEAQACFFRAFNYFQLAKRHGGVILYTDMNLVKDKNRSSAEDTWDLIAEDLDYAAANLPERWDAANSGRVTRYAAFALKSRAMLYAERWEEAKEAADSVIMNGGYGFADKYEEAYKGGNDESILEFAYNKISGPSHSFDKWYCPYGDYAMAGGADEDGGTGTPTQEMVEEYETKDGKTVDWSPWHSGPTKQVPPYDELEPRFAATIMYCGSSWKGNIIEPTETGMHGRWMKDDIFAKGRTVTGYYLRKLLDESNKEDLTKYGSSQTWVEIRLSEVYLNRAEANYRLGNAGAALKDLNAVRTRPAVGLPARQGLSGNELFEAIRHERKVELAYEGHLYWDMRRWKLAHTEYTGIRLHGMKVSGTPGNYTWEYIDCDNYPGETRKFLEKTYTLPVPDSELLNNSAIEQYPEWK